MKQLKNKRIREKYKENLNLEIDIMIKLINKIHKYFPVEEKKAMPAFYNYLKKYNKDIDDEDIIFFLFVRWFLLEYQVKHNLNIVSFILNSRKEFSETEIKLLQNIQDNKKSIFRLVRISEDKYEVFLKDLFNNEEVKITMPKPFTNKINKTFILATIVGRLDGTNYFFGPFLGYDEEEIPILKKNFFGGDKNE